MNIERLKQQLIIDEGCKLEIYLDSLGYPTFGIGHLLTKKDIEWFAWSSKRQGEIIMVSQERIDQIFAEDVLNAIADCKKLFPLFDDFLEEVQEIIANMMFNLGFIGLSKFKTFIKAINEKDYKRAARSMQQSLWFRQVKGRAERLVSRMEKLAETEE